MVNGFGLDIAKHIPNVMEMFIAVALPLSVPSVISVLMSGASINAFFFFFFF
jgi:hypothetical protein